MEGETDTKCLPVTISCLFLGSFLWYGVIAGVYRPESNRTTKAMQGSMQYLVENTKCKNRDLEPTFRQAKPRQVSLVNGGMPDKLLLAIFIFAPLGVQLWVAAFDCL